MLYFNLQQAQRSTFASRNASDTVEVGARRVANSFLAFCLFPFSFFFRLGYSESTFLFFAILVLLWIAKNRPRYEVALIAGIATATRPVGVALLAPLVLYLWKTREGSGRFALSVLVYLPLGAWGLIGFMLYQMLAFGDPLAFAKVQYHSEHQHVESIYDKIVILLRLEPVWTTFDPASRCCSNGSEDVLTWCFLYFLNPLTFVAAIALTAAGAFRRSLSNYELLFVVFVILIPYVTKGYENCMFSMARFISVAFPLYRVVGDMLTGVGPVIAGAIIGAMGCFLAYFAAIFISTNLLF